VEDLLHVVGEGNPLPLLDYHLKTVNGTFREREGGRERGRGERRGEGGWRESVSNNIIIDYSQRN
jgi:hypothetical protein